jgi:hypothetical protein
MLPVLLRQTRIALPASRNLRQRSPSHIALRSPLTLLTSRVVRHDFALRRGAAFQTMRAAGPAASSISLAPPDALKYYSLGPTELSQ